VPSATDDEILVRRRSGATTPIEQKGDQMSKPTDTGYAPVDGVDVYWESYGSGGTPVIVVHGGFGLISMSAGLIDVLSAKRQVVGIELQGHGHTADVDRQFSREGFGDQIAGVIEHLGVSSADVLGYSLGASGSLRAAIQHPQLVRKLVVVSIPVRRDGWYPEVRAQFDVMGRAAFEQLKHSPMYQGYSEVAPDPDAFPTLMDKTGDLQRQPYDWSDEVREMTAQTLLVYADADAIPVSHIAEFYGLLGGGQRDANWDGSQRPAAQLAVLPGLTHYDIFIAPQLASTVDGFLG
jgi:pimeloyl-ACP methyl ester carboxylesterase